jgi:hypothetical protein
MPMKTEAETLSESKCGASAGRAWVRDKNGASPATLARLAAEFAEDDSLVVFFRLDLRTAYSCAEKLFFVISPDDYGDRRRAEWFWERWADDPCPSDEFVEGFAEGALEA